ncbi:hypothetical protein MtrunA17_Chr4g0076851 [Medicago truncatula]|uniref:Uncharacterized protein n=1 Tax=Medicago truncatula TaxID=3880 RepID=A0A396IKH9_MEDTR|nr:hypothetical protein MtrunA17_Chr4g0076851 [Medicago truncatula]
MWERLRWRREVVMVVDGVAGGGKEKRGVCKSESDGYRGGKEGGDDWLWLDLTSCG